MERVPLLARTQEEWRLEIFRWPRGEGRWRSDGQWMGGRTVTAERAVGA